MTEGSQRERDSDAMWARLTEAGRMLDDGLLAEALPLYDEIARDAGEDPQDDIEVFLAQALGNKAWALGKLGRRDEALAVHTQLQESFSGSQIPEIRDQLAISLDAKAHLLMDLGRYDAALEAIAVLQETWADDPPDYPRARQAVADSLITRARILVYYEKDAEAQETIDTFCERYWSEARPDGRIAALEIKGTIRLETGHPDEALSFYAEALSVPVGDTPEAAAPALALTTHQRAKALEEVGRLSEARTGYQAVLDEYEGDPGDNIREIQSRAEAALNRLVGEPGLP